MDELLSPAMVDLINEIEVTFANAPKLVKMFKQCYTNTLSTTVTLLPDRTTYVITGDIPAMWLRDSACQLRPYYILAAKDLSIADTIEGLIRRQMKCILLDPYANAFNKCDNGNCYAQDETEMSGWVWERKYEIDSLCFPIQMAYLLWKNTGRTSHFDNMFVDTVNVIMDTWVVEQNHEENSPYSFIRRNSYFTETLSRDGKGALVKPNIGLTWSGFRPSDDACQYGYLIPSNMFAAVVLGYVAEIAEVISNDALGARALSLAEQIKNGIETYGIINHHTFGKVYAYEVDGYGQYNLMDDANVPSLLSIPYLGYRSYEDEVYQNTRKMILSDANPYFYKGSAAKGIGSPHTPINYIWHISLAIQGLTNPSREYKKKILSILATTDGETNMMHEGFDVNNPKKFTREWFSWANAMFCELLLSYGGYNIITS
ncbi:glycoside hydrolase family 125 protein [Candidatus Epulonipiscium viviparus]|uniref:glycoside hydrolase family 125 protein n=1 Tax=Candidatus Epulonipiscium viviparus TaxID=420336 RepID=UPI0004976179|nr:glycoside hydrolase family 125 protein [Candidatus Epulopiscium viviparus]